jgi:hypothetical protein
MGVTRTFRLLTGGLAGVLALGVVATTSAAEAKPPTKPGGISGLTASAAAHPGDSYDLSATWNPVANATGYRTSLTKGGTVLFSTTVTTPSFSSTLSTTPGAGSLSVRAVVGRRQGKPSTVPVQFADVTAPTGAFSATSDNTTNQATITQDALGDDSGAAGVTRTVDWGDGTGPQVWTTGTTINHTYVVGPSQEVRFAASVTLKDGSGNTTKVDVVPAPVFHDTTKPVGVFSASPSAAWARLTKVTLSQNSLSDDKSPEADITKSINWQDGSAPEVWTGDIPVTHVYTRGGTFTPVVTATDEAGNAAAIDASAVTVKVDSTPPVVKLTLPRRHKASVRSWKTLRGKATDSHGTGVKSVSLRAVEKRGKAWYGYNAKTKKWVKAGTKTQAFARTRAFTLKTTPTHTWAATLMKLTKGTLVYKVRATDLVKNTSAWVSHTATLTRR